MGQTDLDRATKRLKGAAGAGSGRDGAIVGKIDDDDDDVEEEEEEETSSAPRRSESVPLALGPAPVADGPGGDAYSPAEIARLRGALAYGAPTPGLPPIRVMTSGFYYGVRTRPYLSCMIFLRGRLAFNLPPPPSYPPRLRTF